MRFILQDDVYEELPANWDEVVAKANTYVEKKVSDEKATAETAGNSPTKVAELCLKARHKAINAKSEVWRYAAEALRKASHDKCWYCESKQDRSDKPVDHFRPKNSVVEAPGHPGYYWLAFDWTNYRYSCTFCNSKRCDQVGGTEGGKHDHFPVISPPPNATCESDPDDRPVLLDPTEEGDTKLLTFLSNGFPRPAKQDAASVSRVDKSIELYHLDHTPLVRRRKMLASAIAEHVQLADKAETDGNEDNYKFHKKEIIKLVRAKAEFSSAARIYLGAYRSRLWVQELMDRDF